jgi:hypothetical protein
MNSDTSCSICHTQAKSNIISRRRRLTDYQRFINCIENTDLYDDENTYDDIISLFNRSFCDLMMHKIDGPNTEIFNDQFLKDVKMAIEKNSDDIHAIVEELLPKYCREQLSITQKILDECENKYKCTPTGTGVFSSKTGSAMYGPVNVNIHSYKQDNALLATFLLDMGHTVQDLIYKIGELKNELFDPKVAVQMLRITTHNAVPRNEKELWPLEKPRGLFILSSYQDNETLGEIHEKTIENWNSPLYDRERLYYTLEKRPVIKVEFLY